MLGPVVLELQNCSKDLRKSMNISKTKKRIFKNSLNCQQLPNFFSLIWGHFEALFERETAIDFQKGLLDNAFVRC